MPSIAGIGFVGFSVTDVERSAQWYARLFGMKELRRFVHDDGHLGEVVLRHDDSGVEISLVGHRTNAGEPFSEVRTGLDHVEFGVDGRQVLEAWVARLEELGVEHSGIKDLGKAAVLTFRDPDNIQLEFYWSDR